MDTLLISASFFGYAAEIKAELERRGRSVLWFEDRPDLNAHTKILLRIFPSFLNKKCEEYFSRIIEEASKYEIRDVFVIKGEALSPVMIRKMRDMLPRARFTLYFWDSYRNMQKNSSDKVDLFDQAFSFDPIDVQNDSRLKFRSLFFLPEYLAIRDSKIRDIDILFVGTAHSDRFAVLKRLAKVVPKALKFEKIIYMPSLLQYYLYRIFIPSYWGAKKSDFIFQSLSKKEMMALISRAKIVVDIERSIQSGFTMRTIEMLGASRKLITTNGNLKFADFYSEENQLVINRVNPKFSQIFFDTEWRDVDDCLLTKYSLAGWIDEVFYS